VPVPAPLTFGTLGRAWRVLVETVADELAGRERLWSLEAGAGPRTLFDLPEDAFIVGVDRDAAALEANLRLDERVVADLAEYQPWAAGFDLVTCWYVLDSMPEPAPVLDRFASWTATGGLVVLGLPNAHSLRGWWSRVTRRSVLRGSLTPTALRRRFGAAGFTPILQVFFEDADHAQSRRRLGLTGRRWRLAQALVRIGTFGLLDAARTDYVVVFRREG
jgi:SAM-dependent methyltransferase